MVHIIEYRSDESNEDRLLYVLQIILLLTQHDAGIMFFFSFRG
jgi:hypothetical protein